MSVKLSADHPTQSEYDFWFERSLKNYAESKMQANALSEKEAYDLSRSSFERLLPDGPKSKDQHFRVLKNPDGELAGYYWFAAIGAENNRKAFIYDIIIEEKWRGRGYGREAMLMIEDHAKSLALKQIGLHVFAFNKTAVHLYETLGYETTDLVMEKPLE